MEKAEVRRIVNESLTPLRWVLGLQDWTIHMRYERIKSEEGEDTTLGQIDISPEYRTATIVLDPEKFDDRKGVICTLRHELIHLFHADLTVFADQVREMSSDRQDKILHVTWNHGIERLVGSVESALDSMGWTPERIVKLAETKRRAAGWSVLSKVRRKKRKKFFAEGV